MTLPSKDAAVQKISQLVDRFHEQIESYRKISYNEASTRQDFINPFFKALGWDVDNEQGNYESYREVIHEDRQKVASAIKAPDYSFRLAGGKRLFFLEAKKPSVLIKNEVYPAYQIRRYGWSAKMPISIITDFEEFAIYDCTKKPNPTDKASTARIKYLTYDNYLKEFEFIWDTFSKERVLKGGFDKFIQNDKNKKGTSTVDHEFLQSLDNWRTYLATSIAANNRHLDEDELNFVVQQTIDRIIFLRIAEDRKVEPYGQLQQTIKQGDYYQNLFGLFREANEKYNSGLFDFGKDKISKQISIDNKVIKTVVNDLYYPISPYEFSVLSVEILGSAYEQFLGKQITLGKTGKAIIEQKPEVRKAGGVYYTPQYIVDYIVENTVGKLVKDKTPKEASSIKIVDPACGSGSFLLGAYQYLLNWHKDYYTGNGKQSKGSKNNPLTPDGNLTTAEKKRILLNNIYGVDIDANAVEVTKLSLLLKCMEGETEASIATQLRLFNDRILPTLDNNIKSGNSLIDTDFYSAELDFGDEKKIKPFNWKKGFQEVFRQGGFDCVIGNPPYRLMQPKDTNDSILNYFKNHFKVAEFKLDLFHLFYQKGIRILKDKAYLGFITPSSLLNNVYAENLRIWLLDNCKIDTVAITKEKVFADADVYTAVFIFQKDNNAQLTNKNLMRITSELEKLKHNTEITYSVLKQERFRKIPGTVWNILLNENNISLIKKINNSTLPLKEISTLNRGLITGDRDKYFSPLKNSNKYAPILAGADIFRYYNNPVSEYVLFERPKTSGGCWDKEVHFAEHKILIRQIGFSPTASLLTEPIAVTGNVFTVRGSSLEEEKYILAIINSSLMKYYWQIMFSDFKNSFPQVTIFSLNLIPIKETKNKTLVKQIVQQTDNMLRLQQQKQQTTLPTQLEQIEQRIDHTDNQINQLIYQLYELTEEELKIVERSGE